MRAPSPESLAAYRQLAAGLPDALVLIYDADLRVHLLTRPAHAPAAPWAPVEAEGRPVGDLLDPGHRVLVERHLRAGLDGRTSRFASSGLPDGREYDVTVTPLGDGLAMALWQDVTTRNEDHRRLQHLADHDGLTGLLNRRRFELELERHLALGRRYGAAGALLLIDLDHFKYVNDTLGHGAGDELIVLVADVLRERLRDSDALARLGGDEFGVLLARADLASARAVASALVEDLRGHARGRGDGRLRPVTASIGVALVEDDPASAEELLTRADLAMYDAKEAGRDRCAVYGHADGGPTDTLRERIRWLDRVQVALERDGFVLHGQPVVDLRTREVHGHELLLRMVGDSGELIAPNAFLPTAERFGLIHDLDRWVISAALRLAADRGGRYSVNLSAKSMAEPGLVAFIAAELERTQVEAGRLTFEITETAAVTNVALAQRFAAGLHDLGCRLSLDDFGAGFGSFSYLKHLPFDEVKIDGEFVRGCLGSRFDRLVIGAVVQMAAALGKTTVAEFTSDEATARLLTESGVDFGQGFHLGRPVALALSDVRPAASIALATSRSNQA